MKRLLLVTSPPASGKTFVSKKLAEKLDAVVYLDKDTLIPLSKKVFEAAGQPYDRSSSFFQSHVRDAEYEAVVALALEALEYADTVLINAPFTKEIHDRAAMQMLQDAVERVGGHLTVIFVKTRIDVVKQRMLERNSERDHWKLSHWDEYVVSCDFSLPEVLQDPTLSIGLFLFYNSDEREFHNSMAELLALLQSVAPAGSDSVAAFSRSVK